MSNRGFAIRNAENSSVQISVRNILRAICERYFCCYMRTEISNSSQPVIELFVRQENVKSRLNCASNE